MKSEIRFTEIDLLRFVAAIAVLFFHYTFRGAAADDMSAVSFPVLAHFFKYGYLGVDLFFIISGFVILMTALVKSPKEFAVSRITRLAPAFWFCCTLTFLAAFVIGGERYSFTLKQYLTNMIMINNPLNIPFIDGVYWSIMIEIKFYILVFFVIFFKQLSRIQHLLLAWLLVCVLLTLFPVKAINYFVMPKFSPYFIAGAIFYLIHLEGLSFYKMEILAGSFLLALFNAHKVMLHNIEKYHDPLSFGVITVVLVVFYAIFFLIATNRTTRFRFDFWILLGSLTYPLYLIHQHIGFMLFNLLHAQVNHFVLLILITTLMLLIAYLTHIGIEKPLGKRLKIWLDKWLLVKSTRCQPK